MTLEEMDLVTALKLLGLPRELGAKEEEPVMAHNGRYGPYIKCGTETRSLPAEISPLDVTLEKALELLAQPKRHGRGRAAPKEPLKVFDPSPVTEEPIKLLDGRYGPYVTDGATNASLPRGTTVEELDFDQNEANIEKVHEIPLILLFLLETFSDAVILLERCWIVISVFA